jgi:hypothetical protein
MIEAPSLKHNLQLLVDRAPAFLSLPGSGSTVVGVTALIAAGIASTCPASVTWLAIWFVEACLAIALGSLALTKRAAKSGLSLCSYLGPRFVMCFTPPLFVALVLTCRLLFSKNPQALAVSWLLLYGAAIVSGGMCCPIAAPEMGLGFLLVGTIAFLISPDWVNLPLAVGFGGLHIIFGINRLIRYS